jgi:RNA polymerase sigma-70 factor (ECF subfamily)
VREQQVVDIPEPEVTEPGGRHGLQALLDQELSRLPDKYRAVIVLCDLEGKTGKEAAQLLGWPEGTVRGQLSRGRTMLAKRLTRHGLVLPGGTLAGVLSQSATSGSVPTLVVFSTIKAAALGAAGTTVATGLISANVAALTEGVIKTMLFKKLKVVTVVLAVVILGVVGFGGGLYLHEAAAQSGPADQPLAMGEKNEKGEEALAEGKVVDGLCLKLQLHGPNKDKKLPAHGVVVLENVSGSDLNVNLGLSLANGKSYYPTALQLLVLSKGNNTRTLPYSSGLPGIAGRVDPFLVPLPAGSSYTLRCPLDKFIEERTFKRIDDLVAKEDRIAVEFVGQPVTRANSDMQGLTLMRFWQGTVRSNEVKALP